MNAKDLLIFEAARLRYELDMSQQEVAKTLGLSPATLTRMLKKARELGIIKISVQPPYQYIKELEELTEKLRTKLDIVDVIITHSFHRPEIIRKELGSVTGSWILNTLADRMTIGFSGGRSVAEVIPFLRKVSNEIQVVQLMGGVSSTEMNIQADVIARDAAARLGGTCHVIHGPAIFPDEESLSRLMGNKIVAEAVDRFDTLDVSIVGIGTLTDDNPLMQCGFISDREVNYLNSLGCVGDICGHFFNRNGEECSTELAKRMLGIRLEQLAKTPKVCAVAAGALKISAIIAACRAGIVKILITDVSTAEKLMRINKTQESRT